MGQEGTGCHSQLLGVGGDVEGECVGGEVVLPLSPESLAASVRKWRKGQGLMVA